MIEFVVVVIYWTECMPRKFGNEIRLPSTISIDNLPIPLTMTLLPARTSEQGNVIGSVLYIYIYIYMCVCVCVQKKM